MTACLSVAETNTECSKVFVTSLNDKARRSAAVVFGKTFNDKNSVIVGHTEIRKVLAANKISVDLLPRKVQSALDHKNTKAVIVSRMYPLVSRNYPLEDISSKKPDDTTIILLLWNRSRDDHGGFWVTPSSFDECPDGSKPKVCAFGNENSWKNDNCLECSYLMFCSFVGRLGTCVFWNTFSSRTFNAIS